MNDWIYWVKGITKPNASEIKSVQRREVHGDWVLSNLRPEHWVDYFYRYKLKENPMDKYQIGDKIQITGTVTSASESYVRASFPNGGNWCINKTDIDTHTPKPHVWVTGDVFTWQGLSDRELKILMINERFVVYDYENDVHPGVLHRRDFDGSQKVFWRHEDVS